MGAKAFSYDFTVKEMMYLLFKKKKCPQCGGDMQKVKHSEIVDGSTFKSNSAPLYIVGRKVKKYYYCYVCQGCNANYTLSELAERKGE